MSRLPATSLLLLALLGGCATLPEKVAPAAAPANLYAGADCARLDAERARLDNAYQTAALRQYRTRKVDGVGLALVGLPVGSLTGGSQTKSIAAIKGQQEALSAAYRVSNCGGA